MCRSDADKVNSCIRDSINLFPLAVQNTSCKVKDHVFAGPDGLPACFY